MNPIKLVAIVLIALGAAGLAYGGISYTKETHSTQVGPIALTVTDRRTMNVPIWAGVTLLVVGTVLLLVPPKQLATLGRP